MPSAALSFNNKSTQVWRILIGGAWIALWPRRLNGGWCWRFHSKKLLQLQHSLLQVFNYPNPWTCHWNCCIRWFMRALTIWIRGQMDFSLGRWSWLEDAAIPSLGAILTGVQAVAFQLFISAPQTRYHWARSFTRLSVHFCRHEKWRWFNVEYSVFSTLEDDNAPRMSLINLAPT